MTERALVADAVTVAYDGTPALHGVSLQVPAGTFLAVTGPSGAGKSSLLWALGGAVRPMSGSVCWGSAAVTDREVAGRLGIALVPQGNGLAGSLNAEENVLVPLLTSGVPTGDALTRTRAALATVGLEDSGRQLVDELSGGQQQRVALARAFAQAPQVLLADESTSDLDAANRERMIAELRRHAERGAVVVLATHDPEAAREADGELTLDEGRAAWARPLAGADVSR